MTAVIVDDEPLARAYLGSMLKSHSVEILGEGETGIEALTLAEEKQPDLLFLDIQMPDLSGMQAAAALSQVTRPPLLVFVTGFSDQAVKAFEYAAFDFLLKPVQPERLAITVSRARKQLAISSPREQYAVRPSDLKPASRLPVRTDYAVKLIRVEDVEYALAHEKRVYLSVKGVRQKTYYTLQQLESLLPADEFFRIHASFLVRLSLIENINFLGNHTYSATLSDGNVAPVGRSSYPELQKRLGVTPAETRGNPS